MGRHDDLPLTGHLLVSSALLHHDVFVRTVVLILDHHEVGAWGVILNRPLGGTARGPAVVVGAESGPAAPFFGGPVDAHEWHLILQPPQQAREDFGWLVVTADAVPDLPGDAQHARWFRGYTGWSAGQVEAEIAAGGWFVCETLPSDVFTPEPQFLWRDVLRRQPPPLSWQALCPVDPELN